MMKMKLSMKILNSKTHKIGQVCLLLGKDYNDRRIIKYLNQNTETPTSPSEASVPNPNTTHPTTSGSATQICR